MIIRYHRKGDSGLRVCRAGSILVDVVIESIFRTALLTFSEQHGTLPCKCSLLGLGGYGRGELNPLSDVDIMFLFPDDVKPKIVSDMKTILTDEVLYPLWDLGFKVGHSTRTVKESIEESELDFKTRNSLLESRLILGSTELHKELKKTYRKHLDKRNLKSYIEDLIAIQEKRRVQYGRSVFHPEPNIKNGVGGLRDYQGVLWLLHLAYGTARLSVLYKHKNLYKKEVRDFEAAYDFLLRIRNELHLNSNRATDELTLAVQPMIAENLGFKGTALERVEKMMKQYYFHARNSLRIARSLENRILANFTNSARKRRQLFQMSFKQVVKHEVDGFIIENEIVDAVDSSVFDNDPARIIRLFRLTQVMDLKLSIELERLVEAKLDTLARVEDQKTEIYKPFREIIDSQGKVFNILEEMYNLGVLTKLIPEFEALHCYIQHDRHLVRYSEDQKVLSSIQQLDSLLTEEKSNLLKILPAFEKEESISDLYVSLLLYSLKYPGRFRGTDHIPAHKGVDVYKILRRIGFSSAHAKRILSFIDSHREVAHFWHQAEAYDNHLIKKFAANLDKPEFARLSFWFFYCEALGRNPQYWEIHSLESAASIFDAIVAEIKIGNLEHSVESDSISKKNMTRVEIIDKKIPGINSEEIDAHFHLLPERYFATRSVEDVELHLSLVHQLLETIQQADSLGSLKPVIDWRNDDNGEFSVINVVTWDRLGLFYKLAGAISSVGLNILKAQAISRLDHIAIDTFYVSHGQTGQVESDELKEKFEQSIYSILINGEKALGLVRDQYDLNERKGILRRSSDFDATLPVQVEVYFDKELKQLIVDYQGKDRIGLLYRISRILNQENLNIDSVRISTGNGVASGTIFLTGKDKKQAYDPEYISETREKLIAILSSEIWLKE